MKTDPEYHSFLIRLWWEKQVGGEGGVPAWQGEMLHIQTGEKWPLDNIDEVLKVLKAATDDR